MFLRIARPQGDVFVIPELFEYFEIFFTNAFLLFQRLVPFFFAAPSDAPHALLGVYVEVDREVCAQQLHCGAVEFRHPFEGDKSAVVGKRGKIIPIAQHRETRVQLGADPVDGILNVIHAVGRKEQGDRAFVRVDPSVHAGAQDGAEGRVSRLVRHIARNVFFLEVLCKETKLRRFSAAVRSLEYNEFSSAVHNVPIIPKPRAFVNRTGKSYQTFRLRSAHRNRMKKRGCPPFFM